MFDVRCKIVDVRILTSAITHQTFHILAYFVSPCILRQSLRAVS